MTKLPVMSRKFELSGVFLHELLESPKSHNFPECYMHGIRPRFGSENLRGFIGKLCIESD